MHAGLSVADLFSASIYSNVMSADCMPLISLGVTSMDESWDRLLHKNQLCKILTLSSERNSYTQSHFTQSLTKVADWAANTWSTRLSNPKPHWGDNGKQQILSQVDASGKEVHSIVQRITVLANESVSYVQVQATESWLQFPPQPWLPLKTMIFLRLCRAPLSKPSSSVTFLFALRNANTMLHFMEVLVILLEWKSQVKSVLDQWEQRQPM